MDGVAFSPARVPSARRNNFALGTPRWYGHTHAGEVRKGKNTKQSSADRRIKRDRKRKKPTRWDMCTRLLELQGHCWCVCVCALLVA